MEAEKILDKYRLVQGWNDTSCLNLALEYINQQGDNGEWNEYLRMAAELENEDK
jgi:hypothetical protein